MNKQYDKYMRSEAWREIRQQRVDMDGGKCVACHTTERLEVHHLHYQNFGHEELRDLITLCHSCHEKVTDSERFNRYAKRRRVIPAQATTQRPPLTVKAHHHQHPVITPVADNRPRLNKSKK
jgi:hypothetical protein